MKKFNFSKLKKEAVEIRRMIVKRASENSGHCASPLGTVEITQALLAVFDFNKDKIVFDVGHQAHAYKILTGRKEKYFTMSKKNGIAAYPDIHESKYDFYGVGHTSTSISAALGYSIDHQEYKSIALVGDGSLNGGEIFEAMNHAGEQKTNLLVIYNENGYSLQKNVGILKESKRLKTFSESLGFKYVGVFDGHNTKKLIAVLSKLKTLKQPVFLHIRTIKGKGYAPAEKNPESFHWPDPFKIETGKSQLKASGDNWFSHNIKTGLEIIKKYKDVYFVTPAFTGWGLLDIEKKYPKKVIDTGINEQHCATLASSLALNGNKVLCYISSNFLPRCFDQIIDICLQKIPMVFVITFSGISADGPTHQGIYTFPMLNMLPNAEIIHPVNFKEYDCLLKYAVASGKTVFIQQPWENIPVAENNTSEISVLKNGEKLTILPLGNMFKKALDLSEAIKTGEVLYTPILKPYPLKTLVKHIEKTGRLLILEDGFVRSGLGEGIIDDLLSLNLKFKHLILGVKDKFPIQGSISEVYEDTGLDDQSLIKAAKTLIETKI